MSTPDDLTDEEFTDLDEDDELSALGEISTLGDADDDTDEDDSETAGSESTTEDEPSAPPGTDGTGEDDSSDDLDEDDAPDEEEESLDVILAREQDLEEEFSQVAEAPRASPATTPAGEDEFTCRSCFLVKRRAQLADVDEVICLDCA